MCDGWNGGLTRLCGASATLRKMKPRRGKGKRRVQGSEFTGTELELWAGSSLPVSQAHHHAPVHPRGPCTWEPRDVSLNGSSRAGSQAEKLRMDRGEKVSVIGLG